MLSTPPQWVLVLVVVLTAGLALLFCWLRVYRRDFLTNRIPTNLAAGLQEVAVEDARDCRIWATTPLLITGLPPTPPVTRWGSDWAIQEVRVLSSPTGVFAAYGECTIWHSAENGKLQFGGACSRDQRCVPVHSESTLSQEESAVLYGGPRPQPKQIYLRGACEQNFAHEMGKRLFSDNLVRLSAYLSGENAVTNLHWDGAPGILAQTEGTKLVSLFSPGTMPAEAPSSSPCARRSYEAGATCPAGAAFIVRLKPGRGLYIPAYWAHHVVSLSPRTLGAVWRFA